MKIEFDIPFNCPDNIKPFLEKVFLGEYDIRGIFSSPTIIDLGANCGAYSVWAKHRFPDSIIYAYEPDPKTYEILLDNISPYKGINTFNYGIGTPGMRAFKKGKNNCGESSFHYIEDNPLPIGMHLEVKDPLILPEANILKMDIEGCEMEVLEPLIKDGRKFDLITLEYHNHDLRREVDKLLDDYILIGAVVTNIFGLGVAKYLYKGHAS